MLAKDIRTTEVLMVSPATTVAEIAALLLRQYISAVPVVDDRNAVVGILSRANLIRRDLATWQASPLPPVSEFDRSLQQEVLAALRNEPWANLAYANATVENGRVHLWGLSETADQR